MDAHRNRKGRYLLAGSQNLVLAEKVTESLAGRAAMLRLLPLSRQETDERRNPLAWERKGVAPSSGSHGCGELWKSFIRGGYPELAVQPDRDDFLWQASYIQTYPERDVRTLRQVGDLTQYQNFLRVLAARSAQLLNLTDVARDLGVAVNTVKAWLFVLEATYQAIIVRPYFANVGKRLVKTPTVYFTDVGTLCYLAGLKDPEHAAAGPMGGAIFETAVLSEIVGTYIQQLTVELLCYNPCARESPAVTGPSTGHGDWSTMASTPKSTTQEPPTVIRTLRVRLYPGTAANGQYLEQLAGACRFAWNHVLAGHEHDYHMWKAFGKLGDGPGSPTFFTLGQRFTQFRNAPGNEWLKDYSYEISGTPASTWPTPTPHSSTRICPTMGVRSTRPSTTHDPPSPSLPMCASRTAACTSPGGDGCASDPSTGMPTASP